MWIHYERLHNHNKAKAQQNRVHISSDILYVDCMITTVTKFDQSLNDIPNRRANVRLYFIIKLSVSHSNHTKYDTKHNVTYETKIYLILVLIKRVHVRSWATDCAKHDWELQ